MFGLGMMEIGLIVVLAVMLFPPKELPKLARSIARIYGQVRKTADDFRRTVLEDEDLRAPIDEIKGAYDEARFEVRDAERKARQQLAKAQMELRMATARRLQAEREAKAAEEAKAKALAGSADGAANDGATKGGATNEDAMREAAAFPGLAEQDEHTDDGPVAATDPRRLPAPRVVVASSGADETSTDAREGVA